MSGIFEGTVVLITGAGGGIGSAAAHAFAREGAYLTLIDASEAALKMVEDDLLTAGTTPQRVLSVAADVGDEPQVRTYVDATVERHGRLDVLFNNAGVEGTVTPIHEYTAENFDRVMRVNVRGVWLNMKYAIVAMKGNERGGSIINTGSAVSLVGAPDIGPYTASKHAVLGLTRSAALELATSGIRVNVICPGPTDTRMQRSIEENMDAGYTAAHEAVMRLIPMGRYARPEEIAAVVMFLASDAAAFMTGAAVPVDGAFTVG